MHSSTPCQLRMIIGCGTHWMAAESRRVLSVLTKLVSCLPTYPPALFVFARARVLVAPPSAVPPTASVLLLLLIPSFSGLQHLPSSFRIFRSAPLPFPAALQVLFHSLLQFLIPTIATPPLVLPLLQIHFSISRTPMVNRARLLPAFLPLCIPAGMPFLLTVARVSLTLSGFPSTQMMTSCLALHPVTLALISSRS